MSHYFIQNRCWITASFTSSQMTGVKIFVSKMEGKTNYLRRLQAVRKRDCWVFGKHWRRCVL